MRKTPGFHAGGFGFLGDTILGKLETQVRHCVSDR